MIRVWVRFEVSFRVSFWVRFESELIKTQIEISGDIKTSSEYKSFANGSDLIFFLQFMDIGEPDLEPQSQRNYRKKGLSRRQCINKRFCRNLQDNGYCRNFCREIHSKCIFSWLSLRSKPYCLLHMVEALHCLFNCWTSSHDAVNTNFYSLWFVPTRNRTRINRFSSRRSVYMTTYRYTSSVWLSWTVKNFQAETAL